MSNNDRYVVKHGDDWAVKKGGADRASAVFDQLARHIAAEAART